MVYILDLSAPWLLVALTLNFPLPSAALSLTPQGGVPTEGLQGTELLWCDAGNHQNTKGLCDLLCAGRCMCRSLPGDIAPKVPIGRR